MVARGPALAPTVGIRAILVLTAILAAGITLVVKLLPDEASAQPAPSRPRAQEIQSIAIDGGRGLPLAALHARIASTVGELVDEQRLEQDRAAVEAELEARGYLAARVGAPSVTFGARGGAYVVFDVDRGPMFHLRSIAVSGPAKQDAGVVTLTAGDDASHERIAQARLTLAATLERHASAERGRNRRATAPQVDVVLHTDVPAAALDVELVTR
jgi:hypothetical protein